MAKNWAIVVGINDYLHHPERKLNYAVNDAQRIGDFLSDQAGFGTEQVIRCLGDQGHQGRATYPTCSKLLQLLKQDIQPARLGKIDRLWFYFSGHGVSRNGRDYLITSDCWESEIERFGLPVDEVIAALRSHQTADIVLILDACRQVLDKKSFDDTIGKQTADVAKERGITTIFSCDYGQYSYELEALQQGAFTYALIEGLAQHTLPNQLEQYLRRQVPALNLQHRRERVEQTPRIRTESTLQAFQPLLPVATSADLTVLVEQAREAELEENFEAAKQIWWQVIKVDRSGERVLDAQAAIERLERKIARIGSASSIQVKSTELPQSEPRKNAAKAILPTPVVPPQPAEPDPVPTPHPTPVSVPVPIPASTPVRVQQSSSRSPVAGSARPIPLISQSPVSQQWTRQQFLKWMGFGGAGLVTAVVGREVFKSATHPPVISVASPPVISVAAPKYTQLSDEVVKGLPFWRADFETVSVNEKGQMVNRSAEQAKFFKEDLGNGVVLDMVEIPAGSFKMGSPETEKDRKPSESPQHMVNVPTFFMGKFAVTQAQYQKIMGNNPANFKGEKRPVERVSWNDAVEFCQKLSKRVFINKC